MAPPPVSAASSKPLAPATAHPPMMREVTEDTPADQLLGTMDLLVVLPSKTSVRMTVNRRTPMMDLLIQVTTANKINPGGHIVLVRNERGFELRYKPSTPIGALDTTTIEIVPKNQVNEYMIVKKPPLNKPANQPFESTFRLQVHLPRQQLYVMRVGYKTVLQDILDEVCQEKNLDIAKYELRHPMNLDEKLIPTNTLGDYGLQQVTVVSKSSKTHNTSVSAADIMAIQQNDGGRTKANLDSPFKYSRSSVGDSSVSSESAGSGCGVSRSDDDSRSVSPLPPPVPRAKVKLNTTISNASSSSEASSTTALKSAQPLRMDGKPKKRAPAPPSAPVGTAVKGDAAPSRVLTKHESLPPLNHSRHSSDSSGYHDSSPSILSDSLENKRNERPLSIQQMPTNFGSTPLNKGAATSLTNLTSVSSISTSSLASSNGGVRNKRKAPKPPPGGFALQPQTELEEELTTDSDAGGGATAQDPSQENNSKSNSSNVGGSTQNIKDTETKSEDFVVTTRKPTTQRSSSSMSSLSSPSPTSSSPVPLEQPQSMQNTKSKSPTPVPEAALVAAEIDNARATSRNSQAASSSLPQPPPRTARTTVKQRPFSEQQQQPQESESSQPKPKPRPDRKTLDLELQLDSKSKSKSKSNALPAKRTQSVEPEGDACAASAEVKKVPVNPMSRIGVKVLPDNALRDRAARLSAMDAKNDTTDKKLPNKANAAQRKGHSNLTDDSHELPLAQRLQKFGSRESFQSLDDDSDNLEENMELFEVKRKETPPSQEANRNVQLRTVSTDKPINSNQPRPRTLLPESSAKIDADQKAAPPTSKRRIIHPMEDTSFKSPTSPEAEEGRLNRWKNSESLEKTTQNMAANHLSSDNEDSAEEPPLDETHETTHEREHDQASSSESEVSYSADSGVPTTANVTPTPISLEIDQSQHDGEEKSKNSTPMISPTSPTSDESANWSEILQSKAKDQEANMEKAFADFIVDDGTHDEPDSSAAELKKHSSESNFELVQNDSLKIESEISKEMPDNDVKEMASHDEKVKVENVQPEPELQKTSASIPEQDSKLKRKAFAESSTSASRHPPSSVHIELNNEEQLPKPMVETPTSMETLSSTNGETEKVPVQDVQKKLETIETDRCSNGKEHEKQTEQDKLMQEPNSASGKDAAVGLTDLAPEIAQDPNLKQTFQVELEAQFEQWKEEFLKKHAVSPSKSGSKDSSSSVDVDEQEPVPASESLPSKTVREPTPEPETSESKKVVEVENNFDPETPQTIHSVGGTAHLNLKVETTPAPSPPPSKIKDEDIKFEVHHNTSSAASQDDSERQYSRQTSEDPVGETMATNGHAHQNGTRAHVYKYSGPPAIQMATWGERPREKSIAVKNDSDYKMGMGQNDAKDAAEFRPKLGSSGRMHSFNGGAIASPMLNKSTTLPSTRSNSTAVPSVVANWKQKMQSSEEERRSPAENSMIIMESKPESRSPSPAPSSPAPSLDEDKRVMRKSASVTSTLERPAKLKANFSISSASSTLERPTKKLNPPTIIGIQASESQQNGKHVPQNEAAPAKAISVSTHAWVNKSEKSFTIDSKEQTNNLEKFKPSNNVTTVILNNNTTSNGQNGHSPSSTSIKDKKAFFQGVAPVESPTKEIPLPAVNMKSSIATIQKVFQQQKQDKDKSGMVEIVEGKQRQDKPAMVEIVEAKQRQHAFRESSPSLSVSSSSSTFSSRSSSNPSTPTPELIGGPSQSTLMVQKVLKANSFNMDAFKRNSSPLPSSSLSTPSTGSSARNTPSPTVIDTSTNKIYHSSPAATASNAPAPRPKTTYENNKAVIIIGGESPSNGSVGNMYKQQLKVVGAPKEKEVVISQVKPSNSEKVNVNGHAHNVQKTSNNTQIIMINQSTDKTPNPFGITLKSKKESEGRSFAARQSVDVSEESKGEQSKRNVGPMKLAGYTPSPPPPPPPAPVMPTAGAAVVKPSSLSLSQGKQSSFSSPKQSNPTSPMSPAPMADIFNEIKNSGGNFKLKKTGSVVLLR